MPRSQGGRTVPSNLQPAHKSCNNKRGCLSIEEWEAVKRMRGK